MMTFNSTFTAKIVLNIQWTNEYKELKVETYVSIRREYDWAMKTFQDTRDVKIDGELYLQDLQKRYY